MKFSKILAVAALAALTVFSSCKEEEKLGAASISLDPTEVTLTAEAGATATVDLTATREWTVSGVPDWLTVTPNSGVGSNKKQLITLTAKSNDDIERSANISFTIGFADAVLKVKQEGEAGSIEEALLYKNNFDKEDAVNNNGWPYLDKFEGWKNEEGNGIAGISYEFAGISARQSGKLSNNTEGYCLYAGSGRNKLFFAKSSKFAVKDIALDGKTALALSFGGQRYGQDDKDNTFNSEEFKVFVSIDGVKGVEVPVSFKAGSAPVGNWDLATSKFTVPEGTEKLTVVFKCDASKTSGTGGVYSIDDLQLAVSTGGDAIDFSKGESLGLDQSASIPDSDEVTDLATVIRQTPGTVVTILNATVTAVNTKGYVIGKGDKAIYVYKNADPKLAVGDKVSIIGTFKYYWGEYELVDASEKKTGTATPEYPNPTEITKDFLSRCETAAPKEEESNGYNGPWYPIYAHASATVHKDGNYTQFKVAGYDGYMSLVSAPTAMFSDATGTAWNEGDAVELTGYYTGWESKNKYHQFIAISVTGQATFTPVEAAVSGDDVFIAKNAAHDLEVANQAKFPSPITVGDASISYAGDSNTGKYYDAGEAMRVYKNSTVTVSSNRPIVKIEYLFAPKDNNGTYNPVEGDLAKLFSVGSCTFDAAKNILTWTGKAMEVVLTYPLDSGNYRFQQIGVTYGEDVEARLSATPLAISVTSEDKSAKFNVQSNVAWTISSDNESFVCDPTSGEGDKEIIVTFPKNTSTETAVVAKLTVSADNCDDVVVTVTQDKAVDLSQATDLATITAITTNDTEVTINGATVAAVTTKGCILSDGTNHVYVYKNGTPGVEIGDVVNVTGKIGAFNGGKQIASPTITKTGVKVEPVYGNPVDISESFATFSNADKHPVYVTFIATPKKSGNYTNLYFEGGDSPYASFANAPGSLYDSIELGAKYKFTGFYTGKASAYHQIVYVSSEKIGEAAPELKVDKTAIEVVATATNATVNVTANVAWTATVASGEATLVGGDGTTGASVSGNGDGRFVVGFAANTDEEKENTYKVTVTAEGVDPVTVTITQAKAVAQGGGGEEEGNSYYIVFANKANGVTGIDGTQNATTIIGEGTNYVTAKPFKVDSGKCYYGGSSDLEKQSVRLGKSGEAAQLTISLSDAGKVTAKSILVATKNYGGNKNVGATLNVNGIGAQETSDSEIEEITYTFETPTAIDSIVLSSDKAVFVYKIKVNY